MRGLGLGALAVLLVATTSISEARAARVHEGERTGAAAIGAMGTFSIGAERVFGLSWHQFSVDQSVPGENVTFHDRDTTVGLLWNAAPSSNLLVNGGAVSVPRPFDVPRIGFDLAIVDGVTLGGAIGYMGNWNSNETIQPGITRSNDGPKTDAFVVSPRAGWVLGLGRSLALWLRGGFTYWNVAVDPRDGARTFGMNGFALTLEPELVISPVDHVGLTLGLDADVPLGGAFRTTTDASTISQNASVTNLGISAGLVVWM